MQLFDGLTPMGVVLLQSNAKMLLQLIDLAYTKTPVDEAEMTDYFDRGIKSNLAIEHRVAFSQRKMEFLEDFGSSVLKYDRHHHRHHHALFALFCTLCDDMIAIKLML